jgi:hypothetical protein
MPEIKSNSIQPSKFAKIFDGSSIVTTRRFDFGEKVAKR